MGGAFSVTRGARWAQSAVSLCSSECARRLPAAVPASAAASMPNFAGTWKMRSSENFDELLKALGKPRAVGGGLWGPSAAGARPGETERGAFRGAPHLGAGVEPARDPRVRVRRTLAGRWALSPTAPPLSRAGSSRGEIPGVRGGSGTLNLRTPFETGPCHEFSGFLGESHAPFLSFLSGKSGRGQGEERLGF